jgi:hypothetical protein
VNRARVAAYLIAVVGLTCMTVLLGFALGVGLQFAVNHPTRTPGPSCFVPVTDPR